MSDMQVTLIDSMGDDLSVVNAARVSFDRVAGWPVDSAVKVLGDGDVKLISYLAKHNHWSPFAHTVLSFRVKAPIFVARQLQKHTVGLAWNEVSRRYVDSEPEFYIPVHRKRAPNVKQGSLDEFPADLETCDFIVQQAHKHALIVYNALLARDVCPEQARMVLPQSMMTEWIWTGSLFAFSRVCTLRLDSHTQRETQVIAQMIAHEARNIFPVSWSALQGGK